MGQLLPVVFQKPELLLNTQEAIEMSRRLACEEALFAGTLSGANVVAAIRIARQRGEGATAVTLLSDAGLKYLSTGLNANNPV